MNKAVKVLIIILSVILTLLLPERRVFCSGVIPL